MKKTRKKKVDGVRFIYGGAEPAPKGALCFIYGGDVAEVSERRRVAMVRRANEQAAQAGRYAPLAEYLPLLECPFCDSREGEPVLERDREGWYFVFCTSCGARGPRTRDGYLAAYSMWSTMRADVDNPLLYR